jgi:hypothetical protein
LCRNCLLKHVEGKIKEKIEVAERRRRRLKQLLGDLKEKRGYFKLKEEALVTLWKILGDLKEKRGYFKLKEEALVTLCGKFVFEEAMDLS